MNELTVKASELRAGEYCLDGLGDFPAQCVITGVHYFLSGDVGISVPIDEYTIMVRPDAPIKILRPDPAPDPGLVRALSIVRRLWAEAAAAQDDEAEEALSIAASEIEAEIGRPVVTPDPVPDALTVLREWVQAGHDACMAAGCSRLHPEFRSDNGGWVVVNADDLLAKIAELEEK